MVHRNDWEAKIYQSLILQACSDLDVLLFVPSLSNANDQLCFVQTTLLPTTCPHVTRSTPYNNNVLASGMKVMSELRSRRTLCGQYRLHSYA
jgi:hypothetical protein